MKNLFDRIANWFGKLFREEAPQPEVKQEPKPKRKYNKQRKGDFNELLENLGTTFESLKLPSMRESWLDRDAIIGLRKLGVHVPNPWLVNWSQDDITLDMSKPLPAIMCVAIPSQDNDGMHYPKVLFAIKYKKLPWNVAYKPGVPYLFGAAYEYHGKLFWCHMYMTVNRKTGVMNACEELRAVSNVIKANGRTSSYTMKQWTSADFLQEETRTVEQSKVVVFNLMRGMHTWWIGRDERWNVIVKKNGERVTFGVNNNDTPYYFKSREKVVTENGETKKIVHYVREHDRATKTKTTTIKEHIRGLHDFVWNGYQCSVVSPKLETKTAAGFDVAPDEAEDAQANSVYLSKVGKMLADMESRKVA